MKKFLTEEEVDSQEPKRPSFYKLRVFAFMNLYTLYNQYQKWLELVDEYNNQQAAKGYIEKYSDYQ